jgi:AcrR family transcriptional regulator
MISSDMMSSQKRAYRMAARAERQEETRRRIAAATAELHETVGPARTTVAEIARRAGVQRATVYANFPEERDLLAACQGHFLAANPPPDMGAALGAGGVGERVAGVLRALYPWYRRTRGTSENVRRDRAGMPALDALLGESIDARMAGLADALAPEGGGRRALVAVALDFWTWRRLEAEGLGDEEAAELMARAVEIG